MKTIVKSNGGRKVHADIFQSQRDLLSYLESHPPVYHETRDYIHPDYVSDDPKWCGFETGVQLRSDFLACRCDYNAIRRIASNIEPNRQTHKRIKYMSVAQGVPVVPVVLTGMPLNMLSSKRVKNPAKIIDLYIDVTVSASNSSSALERQGKNIMSEVLALEQNGYRINLYACFCTDTRGMVGLMIMKVKDAGQSINVARCQYPIINPQFLRGISFAWYQRAPINHQHGYGMCQSASEFADALRTIGVSDNAIQVGLSDIVRGNDTHEYIASRMKQGKL